MGLVEYTVSPHYFFAIQNLYNYGNKINKTHYPNISAGYTKNTTRFALGYGKQRQGNLCVGAYVVSPKIKWFFFKYHFKFLDYE